MYVIGIDAGATKTHAAIADLNGRLLGEGRGGDANVHTTPGRAIAAHIRKAVTEAKRQARARTAPVAVCIGMAGIDSPEDRRRAERASREAFPTLSKKSLVVVNDVVVARRSNSEYAYGACVISGTGSNAYAVNERGEEAYVGGMDWLLTDDGSGYMVGRAALRAAARSEDGREQSELEVIVKERLGVASMRASLGEVYAPDFDKSRIASFAPLVDHAAARGDAVARGILDAAADELVLMASTAIRRAKLSRTQCDLVAAGSMLTKSPRVYAHFSAALGRSFPTLSIVAAARHPVEGAVRMALEMLYPER